MIRSWSPGRLMSRLIDVLAVILTILIVLWMSRYCLSAEEAYCAVVGSQALSSKAM